MSMIDFIDYIIEWIAEWTYGTITEWTFEERLNEL